MDQTKDTSAPTPRAHGARDVFASVVFHSMEYFCLLLVLDRIPLFSAIFAERGAMAHTAASRTLFDICDFVATQHLFLLWAFLSFVSIDAVVMWRLWRAPKPWAARLWFTAIAIVPLIALAGILAALGLPLGDALAR